MRDLSQLKHALITGMIVLSARLNQSLQTYRHTEVSEKIKHYVIQNLHQMIEREIERERDFHRKQNKTKREKRKTHEI